MDCFQGLKVMNDRNTPNARFGHSMTTCNEVMYVFGESGNGYYGDIWKMECSRMLLCYIMYSFYFRGNILCCCLYLFL